MEQVKGERWQDKKKKLQEQALDLPHTTYMCTTPMTHD